MFAILTLAHLLGDYTLQFNALVRWKMRSIWGVFAHGGIVTLTTLACVLMVAPAWWPYALFIGVTHTLVDIVRARLIHPRSPREDLVWLLLDQGVHLAIIATTVLATQAPNLVVLRGSVVRAIVPLVTPKVLLSLIGYILLLQPAWVMLRYIIRGIYGADAVPHLGSGEKYGPMLERVLIATFVLTGHFYLVPLVLLPRRLNAVQIQGNSVGVMMQLTTHWAETFLGVLLAMAVGLGIKIFSLGGF
ncbi:MAG: DUF3307 domain-containing protein [Anaerolineae bacterium]|nr:DUF3307 domain-containing protein [Anaerolineae bacterium]